VTKLLFFWLAAATFLTGQATYIDSAKMDAAYPKHAVLLDQGQYRVMAIGRDKDGQAELHTKDTDIVYFVEGTATLVTGGILKEGKVTAPGEMPGARLEGGGKHELKAGDVVTIPNGVSHQFMNIKAPCRYFLLKVQTQERGRPPMVTSLSKGGAFCGGDGYKVSGSHREKDGIAEWHERDSDVMYFVRGTATLVTGGKVNDGKSTAPEEVRGPSVDGGVRQALKPGDVVVVPNATPHQFVDVKGPLDYFVVKVRSAK